MLFDCSQVGLFAAAMLAAGHGVVQRLCAACFVTSTFILAWYGPGTPLARGLRAVLAVGSLMATMKIAFSSEERLPIRGRLLQVVALPKSMRAIREPPALSARVAGQVILDLIIAGGALVFLLHTRHRVGAIPSIERLGAGVVLFYAGAQFVFDLARLGSLAMGLSLDSIHRTPIAARSLTEFWSQRWNRIVSAWLQRFVFLPLARRRCPRVGAFCAFLASGVLHGWPVLVAVGTSGAFAMFAFFVVQGALVLAEHGFRIHAWPTPIARGWTLVVLLASSPLFVDPDLRLLGL